MQPSGLRKLELVLFARTVFSQRKANGSSVSVHGPGAGLARSYESEALASLTWPCSYHECSLPWGYLLPTPFQQAAREPGLGVCGERGGGRASGVGTDYQDP